jgi:hypothetical protein
MLPTGAPVSSALYPFEMRRLITMFPAGIPGIALVLLRIGVAATLWEPWLGAASAPLGLRVFPLCLLSVLLLIGLATPLASSVAVLVLLISLDHAGMHAVISGGAAIHAVFAASLALIGPGAFSLDARLFGRRVLTST